jgi:hypothetical protein
MISAGQHQSVAVADIELDRSNPRIRKFLEMYCGAPTPEQIFLALGAGGDDDGGAASTTFDKLKNSILTNGGVIQPVVLNRREDGSLVCIEGNTRVAIYKSFIADGVQGGWHQIPALVHHNLGDAEVDAIRLQVHLVGPRPWDPYSKAKYLHHLRTQKHLPFATIVDFCGGRQRDVEESINAYSDMENYYRPVVPDDGNFDTTRFSGFVELQKPGIKDAIVKSGHDLNDFARWIHEEKLFPLNKVRVLLRILRHPKAREIFLKQGARKAEAVLDKPDLSKALIEADLGQLARALTQSIGALPWSESQRVRADPTGETAQYIVEVHQALTEMISSLGLNG